MPRFWKVVRYSVAAIVAWDVFVVIAAQFNPPLLWIVRRQHYEVTFSIQLPDRIHTARGVVEPVYFADPLWDQTIPPLPVFGMGQVVGQHLNGEAVTMCLPDGKAVSMLLDSQIEVKTTTMLDGHEIDEFAKKENVYSLANKLLTQKYRSDFQRLPTWGDPYITAFSASDVFGSYSIPDDLIPSMVLFENPSDPHSAHLFDPKNPAQWLGPGAKFLGATISVTDAPIHSDSRKCLSWLQDCKWWSDRSEYAIFATRTLAPNKADPIARETNNSMVGIAWCHNFLYRSLI